MMEQRQRVVAVCDICQHEQDVDPLTHKLPSGWEQETIKAASGKLVTFLACDATARISANGGTPSKCRMTLRRIGTALANGG